MDQPRLFQSYQPLADTLRPQKINEFLGLKAPLKKLFEQWIQHKWLPHLLLWGNPGTGKTSLARLLAKELQAKFFELSATSAGVSELREVFEESKKGFQKTVLFLDEVHRLNTKQQDVLLPAVEKGTIILIAATTVDPNHALNSAMRSRLQSIHLEKLSTEDFMHLTLKVEQRLGRVFPETLVMKLCKLAHGDARRYLNWLEILSFSETFPSNLEDLEIFLEQKNSQGVGPTSSERFDLVSAWIKSMRSGKETNAIFYLANLIFIKEDPRFLTRRLMIFAAEDLKEIQHIQTAAIVDQMAQSLGYPEIRIPLSKITLEFARAVKSREAIDVIDRALSEIESTGVKSVPFELRNQYHESEI